jgi:hypothetical protein
VSAEPVNRADATQHGGGHSVRDAPDCAGDPCDAITDDLASRWEPTTRVGRREARLCCRLHQLPNEQERCPFALLHTRAEDLRVTEAVGANPVRFGTVTVGSQPGSSFGRLSARRWWSHWRRDETRGGSARAQYRHVDGRVARAHPGRRDRSPLDRCCRAADPVSASRRQWQPWRY